MPAKVRRISERLVIQSSNSCQHKRSGLNRRFLRNLGACPGIRRCRVSVQAGAVARRRDAGDAGTSPTTTNREIALQAPSARHLLTPGQALLAEETECRGCLHKCRQFLHSFRGRHHALMVLAFHKLSLFNMLASIHFDLHGNWPGFCPYLKHAHCRQMLKTFWRSHACFRF